MLAGDLARANQPAIFGPNTVVIRFPSGYNRQYVTCAETGRQKKIQDALCRVTGETWAVRFEAEADKPGEAPLDATLPVAPKSSLASSDPLIDAIKVSLDARIMRMDEGFGASIADSPPESAGDWAGNEEE